MGEQRKPGVYLCRGCGIGEAVDVGKLEAVATKEQKVPLCRQHDCLCSDEGVALIRQDLEAGTVNQAIIAACSPRVMTDRFHFDGAQVIRANLREQVAWTQPAGDENTQMLAADNVRMAIAQAANTTAPEPLTAGEFNERILVVGGGVSGMTAATEAAATGYDVLLIERSDALGGWARRWSRGMPHRPPYRDLQPNGTEALMARVAREPRIAVMTNTTVSRTEGMPGRFSIQLTQAGATRTEQVGAIVVATGWRPYDPAKLGHLGYGASPDIVTNVELEAMFASGDLKRKSDGKAPKLVAFIQCAGSRDPAHLPYCSSICCGVSIKHALQIKAADPSASVYIIYDELRTPGTAEEFYRQAQRAGVIFQKGKVKSVGADLTVLVDDELLGMEVPMAGLDLVVLATGMVPNATDVEAKTIAAEQALLTGDINALAPIAVAGYAGAAPKPAALVAETLPPGGSILNLQYRQGPHLPILADGFADSHFICFPYETRRSGIHTCGPVRRPMDIAEAREDATGAVMKAIQAIRNAKAGASVHPRVGDLSYPKIGLDICTKCRRCTVECPFGAIDEAADGYPIVNTTRCRRCGTCMGACPVRTISFDNYSVQMVSEMIKSVEVPDEFANKPRLLLLACENDAYPALDMAGVNRHPLNTYVRTVPVRCLGSVSAMWVSTALEKGYDGVMLMGCKSGDDYQCHFVKGSGIARERLEKIGETLKRMALEQDRVRLEEVSIADSGRVGGLLQSFTDRIVKLGLNPFKGF
jgi:quinone-modifying oxidoreductase subunit QmoB